jgi:hypothetical protein
MSDAEERVRERAYELWEQAGRPDGQADEYWRQARAELEADVLREQEQVLDEARGKRAKRPS